MIHLPLLNPPKTRTECENASTSQQNANNHNEEQNNKEMNKNENKEPSKQLRPCGRSYSSAKALKDHIKTVHMDTTIYSCQVSIF